MNKRFFSLLAAFALCLTLIPTTAFADDEKRGEDVSPCSCETACTTDNMNKECPVCGAENAIPQNCGQYIPVEDRTGENGSTERADDPNGPIELSAADQVQAMIDGLPNAEEITEDNAEEVKAQLDAIDEAKEKLSDEEIDELDMTRYAEAAAALGALAAPMLLANDSPDERYFTDFSLFETAQVFRDENYTTPYDEREKLPSQRKHLGAAFVGSDKDITTLFRRAKGVVEAMPRYTHMEAYTLRQVEKPVWADTVVWLNLYLGEEHIGDLALLSKKVSMECGIKNLAVMLLELDMDALIPFRSRTNTFTHLPEYPMTDYDVSVLVDGETRWDAMRDAILEKRHELLHGVSFVDEYRGKQVPEGKKSVTLRLTIGSAEKTLTSQEIEACAASAVKRLAKHVGAELRGK